MKLVRNSKWKDKCGCIYSYKGREADRYLMTCEECADCRTRSTRLGISRALCVTLRYHPRDVGLTYVDAHAPQRTPHEC